MAYGDDDDDTEDHYGGQRHNRGSSYSGGREKHDKTSNFDTTLISEDGRLFGIKLPAEMASQLRISYSTLLDWARVRMEKFGVPIAKNLAKNLWNASEHEAEHFGGKAGNVIGYSVIFGKQIYDVGQNVYDSTQSLNDLRVAVKPLEKANGGNGTTSPLSGSNEVVANARAKINGMFWHRLVQTGVSTIAAAPAFLSKWHEQAAKNHEREAVRRFAEAKGDPEKLAKVLEEEITLGSIAKGMDMKDFRAAKEIMIENERKAYDAKFTKFKAENESKIRDELRDIVKDLEADKGSINSQIRKLNRLGIDTEHLQSQIQWRGPSDSDQNQTGRQNKAVDEFRKFVTGEGSRNRSKQSRSVLEDALRAKFVRQHGAFDRNDLEYDHGNRSSYGSRDNPATIKEQLEQKIEKLREAHQKSEQEEKTARSGHDKNEHGIDIGKLAAGFGAGALAELATKALGGKTLEKYKQPIALDRILHLRRELEKSGDKPPEQVPVIAKSGEKDMGYARYVHEVFQQHQKDCKRTEIGDRFVEDFEKVRWDDSAIQQLPDDKLNPYEYAVKTIAQRIKNGRMDAIALIDLVGDVHKKIVRNDGRSFGPQGVGNDDAEVKKAILRIIDEKTATLNAAKEQTDEQINEKLGNFVFSVADLKHALESKVLEQVQRAFIFTVFSDVVGSDEKLCGKIGISSERCQELRKECKESFSSMLDGAVSVLAEMIEKEPEKLDQHLKLTAKEKKLIVSMAGRAKEDSKNVADVAENREELLSLETTVANAAVTLGKEPAKPDENGKPGFWQRLIAAARQPKEVKKKDEQMSPPYGDEEDNHYGHKPHNHSDHANSHSNTDDDGIGDYKNHDGEWSDDEDKPARAPASEKSGNGFSKRFSPDGEKGHKHHSRHSRHKDEPHESETRTPW